MDAALKFGICLLLCRFFGGHVEALNEADLPWTYSCVDERCIRQEYNSSLHAERYSLPVCRLTCSPYRTLWPRPSQEPAELSSVPYYFCSASKLSMHMNGTKADASYLSGLKQDIREMFLARKHGCVHRQQSLTVRVNVNIRRRPGSRGVPVGVDESYRLRVKINAQTHSMAVNVEAPTRFGSRHALETLKQLIVHDPLQSCSVTLTEVDISDRPMYTYRGVMLDTSRNFFTIDSIKDLLDAMSMFKLNTLHWHITDSHSFPLNTTAEPRMAEYGAYSNSMMYSPADVEAITDHAEMRGIRVLPEIDLPAHAGFGWQWGPQAGMGEMVLCEGESPWESFCVQPPCGQLNPVNDHVFDVLEALYVDLYGSTKANIFHLGGDEVKFDCWNKTAEVVSYLSSHGHNLSSHTYHMLWGNFSLKSYEALRRAYANVTSSTQLPLSVFWTSTLTSAPYLEDFFDPRTAAVMYWEDLETGGLYIKDIMQRGLRVILSNYERSYMDCGFPHYVNDGNIWCSPYKDWQTVYENNFLLAMSNHGVDVDQHQQQIMGGQVLLWTEVAAPQSFLYKFLPRMMAAAEVWWASPQEPRKVDHSVRDRMYYVQHMLARNYGYKFRSDVLTSEWCVQNPTTCWMD